MTNQTQNAISSRGGIQLRDYTRGEGLSALNRGGLLSKINFDKVARGLVFASLGLGLMEVFMPGRLQKMVGVRRGNHTGLIRFMGLRELGHALLLMMRSQPVQGAWSRVAGDAMDLAVLGRAFTSRRAVKDRVGIAAASVLGLTALDALTASQLQRKYKRENGFSSVTRSDLNSRSPDGSFHVTKSITINRSPEELYQFWRSFDRLPQFMYHLEAVRVIDERRSHWVAKAPAGTQVEWDAEITDDRPNQLIAWRSLPDAGVTNSGQVSFERAPGGRRRPVGLTEGTVVRVMIDYRPPAGAIGKVVATLFGEEPGQQVAGDLHRFKQVMELGEVVRSEGSPSGYGQKLQPPARPKDNKNEERMARAESKQEREREQSRVRGERW